MASRLIVENLWEGYRPKRPWGWSRHRHVNWALRDVSLRAEEGESVGVIGANGSGKTTLLRVIAGIFPPTRGRVMVRGRVATLVDLTAGVHRELTGRENLMIAGVLLGMTRAEVRARYAEIAAFTGLTEEELEAPLSTYSQGMELRLGFSLAVCSDPSVLLVDEVLAVGDDAFQGQCLDRLQELRAGGASLVLISHDLELIRSHCDRVVVLDQGAVAFTGAPGEAVERYRQLSGSATQPAPDGGSPGRQRPSSLDRAAPGGGRRQDGDQDGVRRVAPGVKGAASAETGGTPDWRGVGRTAASASRAPGRPGADDRQPLGPGPTERR